MRRSKIKKPRTKPCVFWVHILALYWIFNWIVWPIVYVHVQIAAHASNGVGGTDTRKTDRGKNHDGMKGAQNSLWTGNNEKMGYLSFDYWEKSAPLFYPSLFSVCLGLSCLDAKSSRWRIDCKPWLSIVFPRETLTDKTVDRMGASSDLSTGWDVEELCRWSRLLFVFSLSPSLSLLLLLCPWTEGGDNTTSD